MSEGPQELYPEEQGLGDGQQPSQQYTASGHEGSSSASPQSHKRKRDSVDDFDAKDEGRESSTGGRRTSVKQTSPNMSSATGSFMPVNTATTSSNQYAYQPLNMAQGSGAVNGSVNTDAANAANAVLAAAGAMSSLMPSQSTAISFAESGKTEQHGLDNTFHAMSPPPIEGHTEGVGGLAQQQAATHQQPTANPKPQVGTEEWHRVRRDNHKEG